jgi:hypothetical protein
VVLLRGLQQPNAKLTELCWRPPARVSSAPRG